MLKRNEHFGTVDVTKVSYKEFINPKNKREAFRVIVECTAVPKDYDINKLSNPERIYVDIFNSKLEVSNRTIEVNDDVLQAFRLGQFDETTVRVVIDLKQKLDHDVELCTEKNKLCIDIY